VNAQLRRIVAEPDRNRRAAQALVLQHDIESLARSNARAQVVLARLVDMGVIEIPMDDDEPIRLVADGGQEP
jgi:hypothetical protein